MTHLSVHPASVIFSNGIALSSGTWLRGKILPHINYSFGGGARSFTGPAITLSELRTTTYT